MDISEEKLGKLCEIIGGTVKVPDDPAYTIKRCIIDEKDLFRGNEQTSPYIFHTIGDILKSRHSVQNIDSKLKEIQDEFDKTTKDMRERRDIDISEQDRDIDELKIHVRAVSAYGSDIEKDKASKILDIIGR